MDLEDCGAALDVGWVYLDLPIEPARADECLIENIGAVCRSEHDNAVIALEAVHLCEELVHCLLTLIVTLAETRAALPTNRIDLVDENDAGGRFLCICKEVPHPRGTDASEDLHKLRGRDTEERHTCLPSHGLGKERLARAGWAHEEGTLRNLRSQFRIARAVLQEVDHLDKLLFGAVATRDIAELHLRVAILNDLCGRLAELERVLAAHARRAAGAHACAAE
mmetsp:Transcript_23364/g.49740  ORF Transcript_23364/g.49740 Transcript_23364/m.49740 type:complete len:223 (+) Transcript_23364:2649-3317(+)